MEDGTFAPERQFLIGPAPSSMAAGNFNEDGHLDLAVTTWQSSSVSVLLGMGMAGCCVVCVAFVDSPPKIFFQRLMVCSSVVGRVV